MQISTYNGVNYLSLKPLKGCSQSRQLSHQQRVETLQEG